MKIRLSAIFLLIAFSVCGPGSAQVKQPIRSEQRHFSAEDTGVKKPVVIPDDVLAILAKDERVRLTVEYEKPLDGKLPASWFSASAIHLSSPDKTDLVVVGVGPLLGANVTTFWIFSATPNGHELAMTAAAHDLIVKKTLWKGYREIEMSGETAVEITRVQYRWEGKQYVAYEETLEPIE